MVSKNYEIKKYEKLVPIPDKLKNEMRRVFNKHDPISIFYDNKINFDEYDPEIELIMLNLKKIKDYRGFLKLVYQVFQKMFSKEIAGKIEDYDKLAKEIFKILKKSRQ